MLWFWLTVAGGLFGSVRSLITRVIMRDEEESLAYAFIYQAMLAIFIIPFLGFGFKLPRTIFPYLVIFLVGVFDTLALYLFLESARFLEASFRQILIQAEMIWVLFFGVLLLQESLNLSKFLGVGLILLGIILATYQKEKKAKFKNLWLGFWGAKKTIRKKGIIFTLVATTLEAFGIIAIKTLLDEFSPSIVAFGVRGISAIYLLLIIKDLKPRVVNFVQRKKGLILTHGLAGTAAFFLFLWATSLAEVSRTLPIAQSFTVLTVLAGIAFLKERGRVWQKIFGSVLAAIGVILVKGV